MQGMKKQSRFGRTTSVCACFIAMYVAALGGASQGLILCLCSDGHVTVEVQCQPDECCPASNPGAALAGFLSEPGSADPCIDIPLFFEGQEFNVQRTVATPSLPHTLAFATLAVPDTFDLAVMRVDRQIPGNPPPSTAHLALSSDVLLI